MNGCRVEEEVGAGRCRSSRAGLMNQQTGGRRTAQGGAFAYPGVSRRTRGVVGGDGKGGGGWLQARKRCCREWDELERYGGGSPAAAGG